jgi:O-antigen/teichoic acid export membrane protein
LVLLPYWASFAEAAHQKDKKWIQSNIKRLVMIWCCIALLAIVMVLLSNTVYKLWIGKDLEISTSLSLTMCISILLTAWYNIFGYFLNGISETKLQTKILIISALFNLPLSFLLLNYFESTGVILATCIALIPLGILLPLQYRSIIKQMI